MLRKCNADIRSICYIGDIKRTKARSLQEPVRSLDEETDLEVKNYKKSESCKIELYNK